MRVVVAVLLASASVARAQAPGEVSVQPAAAARAPTVMDRRWAVSASLGSLGLAPQRDDADSVTFGMLELAARFRIRAFVEVGVSFYGGGAAEGELSTAGLYLDGRYRFLAERPWNVLALLSLGIASVAHEDAGDDAKHGRGSVRLGVGVERRFRAFAIHAELRLVHVGENQEYMPIDRTPANELARAKLGGGSLSLGGTFYF